MVRAEDIADLVALMRSQGVLSLRQGDFEICMGPPVIAVGDQQEAPNLEPAPRNVYEDDDLGVPRLIRRPREG